MIVLTAIQYWTFSLFLNLNDEIVATTILNKKLNWVVKSRRIKQGDTMYRASSCQRLTLGSGAKQGQYQEE